MREFREFPSDMLTGGRKFDGPLYGIPIGELAISPDSAASLRRSGVLTVGDAVAWLAGTQMTQFAYDGAGPTVLARAELSALFVRYWQGLMERELVDVPLAEVDVRFVLLAQQSGNMDVWLTKLPHSPGFNAGKGREPRSVELLMGAEKERLWDGLMNTRILTNYIAFDEPQLRAVFGVGSALDVFGSVAGDFEFYVRNSHTFRERNVELTDSNIVAVVLQATASGEPLLGTSIELLNPTRDALRAFADVPGLVVVDPLEIPMYADVIDDGRALLDDPVLSLTAHHAHYTTVLRSTDTPYTMMQVLLVDSPIDEIADSPVNLARFMRIATALWQQAIALARTDRTDSLELSAEETSRDVFMFGESARGAEKRAPPGPNETGARKSAPRRAAIGSHTDGQRVQNIK